MRRAAAVVWALSVIPLLASAAEVTRVASSFEDNHPFGVFVDVAYLRTQHNGVITREVNSGGERADVPQLNYVGVDSRLDVGLHIGIWRDLELSLELPIVFSQTDAYDLASGVDPATSPLLNNCVLPNGTLVDPTCLTSGAGAQPMGPVPSIAYRSGLGNLRFGIKYAILRQTLDASKPTWTIGFKYDAPTAPRYDPAALTSPSQRTGVGDKVHRFIFGTALSRRLGIAEPYMRLEYTLPFRGPGFYSNCDRTDLGNLGAPENCTNGAWNRADTGINAPHVVGMMFGTEVVPLDRQGQRVSIDFRGLATWYSGGRYYNELTPFFRKLMSSEGYLDVGGSIGFTGQPAQWITFRVRATYTYQTDRTVTAEPLGKDLDGDGRVSYQVAPAPEVNPTFDHRVDLVGRRLRLVDNGVFGLDFSASLNF